MAERKPANKPAERFTKQERAAMRERAREAKGAGEGEAAVVAKIKAMKPPDRALAERVHAVVRATAPELSPKLWYGMPAYARDGKVVCFFRDAAKFKTRYATLGFSDKAHLDDGAMWPTDFAVKEWTAAAEARIVALVKKAVG
ncbi:MAG: iron chaperone [Acidobacteriota bacterium]